MTVEIRHLRAFLAIADELNLTRAARRLNLTQPALSRTLAQLERDLGTRLVERSTHHVALTDAGRRFEQHAFDAVRAFEQALAGAVGQELPLRLGHSWSSTTYLSGIVRAWNARAAAVPAVGHPDRGPQRRPHLRPGRRRAHAWPDRRAAVPQRRARRGAAGRRAARRPPAEPQATRDARRPRRRHARAHAGRHHHGRAVARGSAPAGGHGGRDARRLAGRDRCPGPASA